MPKITQKDVLVPADVSQNMRAKYINNYLAATQNSGRLMLFAGDQKIEHLNKDFFGEDIHLDDATPEHLFRIASQARIGILATQLGLIAKYGSDYKDIRYLVKLNSKSNLVKSEQKDPYSPNIWEVNEVLDFQKNSGLKIVGVGYTVYLGSEYEAEMVRGAAKMINDAHKNGLITVLWMYPRGKAVQDEKDPHLIAGAAGVGACLGTDFVKINPPKINGEDKPELLEQAVRAAGRTKVICAGGSSTDVKAFLEQLYAQIQVGTSGNATGRNIHQKGLKEAVAMCNAISAITFDGKSAQDAFSLYEQQK